MATWNQVLQEISQVAANPATIPQGQSAFDVVRRKYLSLLSAHTKRSTILYATKWTQPGGDPAIISIVPEDVQGMMENIHGLPSESLDLILHSPGGSAEAAESLVIYLRSKFKNIRIIVPHAAMSAACMLACSADKIVMGKHSFLGPIDPQFIIETPVGRRVAAAHAIVEQFQLAQAESADPKKLGSWLPILQFYGPALIVQCKLAQQLSQDLVASWLEQFMFAGQHNARTKGIAIAGELANHAKFKSHGRFIPRDWALSNGLLVDSLEADQTFQDLVLSVFHAASHTFGGTLAAKLIENNAGRAFIRLQPPQFAQPQLIMTPQLPIGQQQPPPPMPNRLGFLKRIPAALRLLFTGR